MAKKKSLNHQEIITGNGRGFNWHEFLRKLLSACLSSKVIDNHDLFSEHLYKFFR